MAWIAPYALGSAQLSYRLSRRWSIQANYQIGISRDFDWEVGLDVGAPQTSLDLRHWQHQFGIGLSCRLGRRIESLWWQNPTEGIYSDVARTRKVMYSLTEDYDSDGVPDLYDKEPDTPDGIAVDPSGRALDLDRNESDISYSMIVKKPGTTDQEGRLLDERKRLQLEIDDEDLVNTFGEVDEKRQDLLNQLRQDFRDAAFWEVDLRTDAQGEASVIIQYPDDITGWHCYALAMNENRQIGYTRDTVVAQAPLLARLELPQTLRKGDELDVVGRVQSLQQEEQEIYTRFVLEDSLFEERPVSLEGFWREDQLYRPSDTGKVQLAYLLRDSTGFSEGELRELTILDNRIPETVGRYFYLEGDTSLSLDLREEFAASQNVQLIAYHQPIEFLRERAEWLMRYPHGCNEQLASRLIAIHLQLQWSSDSVEKSVLRRRKGQVLRKLARSQNKNGSWGWWAENAGDQWMTQYILEALTVVSPEHKSIRRGQSWLLKAFREAANPTPKLAYYLLKEGLISQKDYQLPELAASETKPSIYTRLLRLAIRQALDDSISVNELIQLSERDALGGRYWSSRGWRWYGSQIECTALAYDLIQQIDSTHPALAQTRQFLLMADHAWQAQTVETARMLQVLAETPMDLQQKPKLQISREGSSSLYEEYPLRQNVSASPISLRKAGGGPILLSISQTRYLETATPVDSLFVIRSSLQSEGLILDSLQKGEQMELIVEVEVRYESDHLMLEVPIPAGCTYAGKPQPMKEAYREYRRDRTNIYLGSLSPGSYRFQIPLESRFSGNFQLMPARMELMYVPTQFGRNEKKRVRIEP
ncbi:MAG: alpha-2-macroglobulin family protein [Bacteroidota bacterium]